jgi:hypothetical protein
MYQNLMLRTGSNHLAGDARGIIQRCHEGQGVIWTALHPISDPAYLSGHRKWFLSSGREYPIDPRRVDVSSTKIRQALEFGQQKDIYVKIKDMALNPRRLLQILGLEYIERPLALKKLP